MTRNKITIDQITRVLRAHGVEPMIDVYNGPNQKLTFHCKCADQVVGSVTARALIYQNVVPRCGLCRHIEQKKRMAKSRQFRCVNRKVQELGPNRQHALKDEINRLLLPFGIAPLDRTWTPASSINFNCGGPCNGATASISLRNLRNGKIPRCKDCSAAARPRGTLHPRWNDQLTDEQRTRHRPHSVRQWEAAVLQFYNGICLISGQTATAAHHIYCYDRHPDLRCVVKNGVALTARVHRTFHRMYGYGNNTYDQFCAFFQAETGLICPIEDPMVFPSVSKFES